jgi:hypothetical protein
MWFYPATGQTAPIGGLPRQQSGYQFIRAPGGWAVQASPDVRAACASCAGPPRTVYFLADSGQSVTQMGLASAVAPGAVGTLWLTSYPPGADPRTAAGVARKVSRAARPSGSQVTLPAGYLIERGTSRGLLLAPVARGPGAMADELWDPATARPGRTFARVIAASATEVAWVPPCVTRCRLQVLNLAAGRPEPLTAWSPSWASRPRCSSRRGARGPAGWPSWRSARSTAPPPWSSGRMPADVRQKNVAPGCREPAPGSVPGVNTATMGRTSPRRT